MSAIGLDVEDVFGLSPLQQGMLFHTLREPHASLYFQQALYTLESCDVDALERAFLRVIERHPVLRTSFHWGVLENPVQVVHRKAELPLTREDWRNRSQQERESRLSTFLEEDRRRGFEMSQAPLMRLALLHMTDDTHQLVWSHHHLLLDGWSLPLVLREIFVHYEAFRRGDDPEMPRPRPFRDYITWLREQDLGRAEAFWRHYLRGAELPTPLPLDKGPGRVAARGDKFDARIRTIPAGTTAALNTFARANQLTLNTLVQGAWALVLARHAGREDVVFGAVVSGRPPMLEGVESMVGMFLNNLPVRVPVPNNEKVLPWLRTLRERQTELQQYEYSPLVEVRGWAGVAPDTPLFESVLTFENYPHQREGAQKPGGLKMKMGRPTTVRQNYPLHLEALPGNELILRLTCHTGRFDPADAARLLERVQVVLEAMAESPDCKLEDIPLMTDDESRRVVSEWNHATRPYPRELCLHQLFEAQTERTPDAVALVFHDRSFTYRELNEEANRLAHHLRSLGVGPDMPVGLSVHRSPMLPIGMLAIMKAGGAYVPLDPAYPATRLSFILQDSGADVLLTQESLLEHWAGVSAKAVCLDANRNEWANQNAANPANVTWPEHLAYILYTSGSTGQPKGVAIPHRVSVNRMHIEHDPLQEWEVLCAKTSPNFVDSIWEFFLAWRQGLATWLADDRQVKDPALLVDLLGASGATRIVLVPSLLRSMLQAVNDLAARVPRLMHWISSGEPLPRDLSREFAEKVPGRVLTNLYGTSEIWDATRSDSRQFSANEALPIGAPLANTQAYVLDTKMRAVPIGVPGELYIGGDGMARGYWRRPALTAERFMPDPFGVPGSRMYRTGDMVRWSATGQLEFLGRADQQVKLRGFRIEISEIEAVLARHPGVKQAAVAVTPQELLAAFFVADAEPAPTAAELREFAAQHLPEFMVPARFVMMDKLPLTPSGKLDRRSLPTSEVTAADDVEYAPPQGADEEAIAAAWADILRIKQVGRNSNFFNLGGHSLLAARVISKLRNTLGVELPLRSIFDRPTLAGLAALVADARQGKIAPVAPEVSVADRGREVPLSFAQERLWVLDQIEPGSISYTLPNPIRLNGDLDEHALGRALTEIVRRHEALRTVFVNREGRPFQVIEEPTPVLLQLIDLSGLTKSEREAEARKHIRELNRLPWDLSAGPLMRARLVRFSSEEHLLALTMHHIVTDGWSMAVFAQELGALYGAFKQGRPSPLPELEFQYADFSVWQRQWLQGPALEEQLAYWKSKLGGAATLELPTDRPRPAVQRYRAARQPLDVPADVLESLQALSRDEGATLFMTVLAAFQLLLSRYSGQDDISVGTPVANRNRAEFERLIGFFANTLVMRTDLSGDLSFRELLRRVREACLGAYDHQDVPFEKLVAELQPQRDLSRQPLFQVLFVLQRAPKSAVNLPGLSLGLRTNELDNINFDLTLQATESDAGLQGSLYYNTDLFDDATGQRMAAHLRVLLEGIAAHPDVPLSQVSFLTPDERLQVLGEWNAPTGDYPRDLCIHNLFEARVDAAPDHPAVEFEDRALTYSELDRRANQLAHRLRTLGVGPEVPVGLCTERVPEAIVGLLGILKAGGAYVPLDPAYPRDRLGLMLRETGATVLLTQDHLRELLPDGPTILRLDADWHEIAREPHSRPQLTGVGEALLPSPLRGEGRPRPQAEGRVRGGPDENTGRSPDSASPTTPLTPDSLAYIIFTSGSTGTPKGVLAQHRGLVNLLTAHVRLFDVKPESRVLQMVPFSFDASLAEIFRPLTAGATLVQAKKEDTLPGPGLAKLLRDKQITVVTLVPSVLGTLPPGEDLPALRTLNVGGEACPPELAVRWGPGRRMVNGYGPTETTVGATLGIDWPAGTKPPLGRPLPNVRCYVLDRHMQPVPVGVPGELLIGGIGVTRGYLNRPALTAEKFIPDSFGPEGSRMYRTGDLVRWLPDGQLEFLGRIDHQVKLRGFRIELGESEAVLGQHPQVSQGVVEVRDDGGTKRLVGYLVPRDETPSPADLRKFLKDKLPDYMVPAAFVVLPALPLTVNGKVDRKALPAPDSNQSQAALDENYVAPQTEPEQILAGIWADVLRLPKVGTKDNFFSLGGDSILCIQVVARAGQAGLKLSPKDLFRHQTIAELAAAAEVVRTTSAEADTPDAGIPTPAQLRILEQNNTDGLVRTALFESPRLLDADLLRDSLGTVIAHHDALRLRFQHDGAGWRYTIAEVEGDIPLEIFDFSNLDANARQNAVRTKVVDLQNSLSLRNGPILRAGWFNLGPESPGLLLFVIHRIVADAESITIVLEDLLKVYGQRREGQKGRLPALPVNFEQWSNQMAVLARSVSEAEHSFWLAQDGKNVSFFPQDSVGKDAQTAARTVTVGFDTDTSHSLFEELPRSANTQPAELLLAALAEALARRADDRRVLVDVETDLRTDSTELARTVGNFTARYPLLLNLESSVDAGEALQAVCEQVRAVPAKGVGFGLLRDEKLRAMSQPTIGFRFTGEARKARGVAARFQPVAGDWNGIRKEHLLDVEAERQAVHFHGTAANAAELEALAEEFRLLVGEMIEHCQAAGVKTYTPADFPEANLSRADLDSLLEQIRSGGESN